jgi:hypothetical protein
VVMTRVADYLSSPSKSGKYFRGTLTSDAPARARERRHLYTKLSLTLRVQLGLPGCGLDQLRFTMSCQCLLKDPRAKTPARSAAVGLRHARDREHELAAPWALPTRTPTWHLRPPFQRSCSPRRPGHHFAPSVDSLTVVRDGCCEIVLAS